MNASSSSSSSSSSLSLIEAGKTGKRRCKEFHHNTLTPHPPPHPSPVRSNPTSPSSSTALIFLLPHLSNFMWDYKCPWIWCEEVL
ncbi:hypothetical protein CMV_018664 [Castanea mollissima]|uniref:Uncharacterized protein n=1 Tax=Castanea mollissima TaxID=60419 RepID=A0A8J4QRA0_9ROSI|nr:hypothetical protein CMV_018664 [Castanea mollissima]